MKREQAIQSGEWDLVILDEINYAIGYNMLDPAKVVAVLKAQTRAGARDPDRTQRAPVDHRDRRHRHRDEASEARLRKRRRWRSAASSIEHVACLVLAVN